MKWVHILARAVSGAAGDVIYIHIGAQSGGITAAATTSGVAAEVAPIRKRVRQTL